MIKNFKKNDEQTTPFVATKPWVLTNFNNQNVILVDDTDSLALEFVDYESGTDLPIINRQCNIALDNQPEDKAIYEEGQKIEGTFYPESDPKNYTGTYKRLIYNQIKNSFYNTDNNPTQIFGMENIDFQLSQTKKFLADNFRVFNVPRELFGEKMLENSIILIDNSLDDNFEIVDDGNGNIVAKKNLFSRVQEVRKHYNDINPLNNTDFCQDLYTDIESRQAGTGGPYGTSGTSGKLPSSNCQPW